MAFKVTHIYFYSLSVFLARSLETSLHLLSIFVNVDLKKSDLYRSPNMCLPYTMHDCNHSQQRKWGKLFHWNKWSHARLNKVVLKKSESDSLFTE